MGRRTSSWAPLCAMAWIAFCANVSLAAGKPTDETSSLSCAEIEQRVAQAVPAAPAPGLWFIDCTVAFDTLQQLPKNDPSCACQAANLALMLLKCPSRQLVCDSDVNRAQEAVQNCQKNPSAAKIKDGYLGLRDEVLKNDPKLCVKALLAPKQMSPQRKAFLYSGGVALGIGAVLLANIATAQLVDTPLVRSADGMCQNQGFVTPCFNQAPTIGLAVAGGLLTLYGLIALPVSSVFKDIPR